MSTTNDATNAHEQPEDNADLALLRRVPESLRHWSATGRSYLSGSESEQAAKDLESALAELVELRAMKGRVESGFLEDLHEQGEWQAEGYYLRGDAYEAEVAEKAAEVDALEDDESNEE